MQFTKDDASFELLSELRDWHARRINRFNKLGRRVVGKDAEGKPIRESIFDLRNSVVLFFVLSERLGLPSAISLTDRWYQELQRMLPRKRSYRK